MKFVLFLLSIFASIVLFSSCKKDSDVNANDNIENFPASHFQQIEDLEGSLSSVNPTTDGGFILTGEPSFPRNLPLIKLSADCSVEWITEFDGISGDRGNEAKQVSDGSYLIAGATRSFGAGSNDAYLILTNPIGEEYWSRTFGTNRADQMESVLETIEGNFIGVGWAGTSNSETDLSIIKTNDYGQMIDSRNINRTSRDKGFKIVNARDDEFVILGLSGDLIGSGQLFFMKIDKNLDTLWTFTFEDVEYFSTGYDLISTNDGGFLAATNSQGLATENDINLVLIKLDSEGNLEWQKEYDGGIEEFAHAVVQTSDNGYLAVSGTSDVGNGELDWMLTKTDELGNELWSKTYGGSGQESPFDITKTVDGYLICGYSSSVSNTDSPAMVILKVDEDGMPK